jgi:ribosomal protein L29
MGRNQSQDNRKDATLNQNKLDLMQEAMQKSTKQPPNEHRANQ